MNLYNHVSLILELLKLCQSILPTYTYKNFPQKILLTKGFVINNSKYPQFAKYINLKGVSGVLV